MNSFVEFEVRKEMTAKHTETAIIKRRIVQKARERNKRNKVKEEKRKREKLKRASERERNIHKHRNFFLVKKR